eukprot:g18297.t1
MAIGDEEVKGGEGEVWGDGEDPAEPPTANADVALPTADVILPTADIAPPDVDIAPPIASIASSSRVYSSTQPCRVFTIPPDLPSLRTN